jgi:hypothetical protein
MGTDQMSDSLGRMGQYIFFSLYCLDRLWGLPTLLHNRYVRDGIYRGGKRPKHEVDCSPLSGAEIKNDGAIPPVTHTSSEGSA